MTVFVDQPLAVQGLNLLKISHLESLTFEVNWSTSDDKKNPLFFAQRPRNGIWRRPTLFQELEEDLHSGMAYSLVVLISVQ